MNSFITGIQQIGIGVKDINEAKYIYKNLFGMAAKIFDDEAEALLMSQYTGNNIHKRHAILAMNLAGGGGFEIWQFTSKTPTSQPSIVIGDIGIFAVKIKTNNVQKAHTHFSKQLNNNVSPIQYTQEQTPYFWLTDSLGNIFQIIPTHQYYSKPKSITAGVGGVVIGVSNLQQSILFYTTVFGFTVKETNNFTNNLFNKSIELATAILEKPANTNGAFATLLGGIEVELVQALNYQPKKIFANRFWGDCGFIHVCFDVIDMQGLLQHIHNSGYECTVDSQNSFAMEGAAGRFCYIEDVDGTLIELVETHKIPIAKKLHWYINLYNQESKKPLPKWMVKCLGFSKIK